MRVDDKHAARIDGAISILENVIHGLKGLKTHPAHWVRVQGEMARAEHVVRNILLPVIKEWQSVTPEKPFVIGGYSHIPEPLLREAVKALNITTSEALRDCETQSAG